MWSMRSSANTQIGGSETPPPCHLFVPSCILVVARRGYCKRQHPRVPCGHAGTLMWPISLYDRRWHPHGGWNRGSARQRGGGGTLNPPGVASEWGWRPGTSCQKEQPSEERYDSRGWASPTLFGRARPRVSLACHWNL